MEENRGIIESHFSQFRSITICIYIIAVTWIYSLKISNIQFKPYKIPFKAPFKTAIGEYCFREGIIIEIQSDKLLVI